MSRVEFFTPYELGPHSWGTELLVAHTPDYIGKVSWMREGASGARQSHARKDESVYIFSGAVRLISADEGDTTRQRIYILKAGMAVRIPPGTVHQVEALEDAVLFETSTPYFDDRVPAA